METVRVRVPKAFADKLFTKGITVKLGDIVLYEPGRLGSGESEPICARDWAVIEADSERDEKVPCEPGFVSHAMRNATLTLADSGSARCAAPTMNYPDAKRDEFLFGINESCKAIRSPFEQEWTGERPGLVVLAGGTSTAKTTHLRHLVAHELTNMSHGKAPLHVLCLEDPPELSLFRESDPRLVQLAGYSLTVRNLQVKGCLNAAEKKREANLGRLRVCLETALRQKPTVVVVGESRNDADLEDCLWFAGTGHRIYTTMHAGTLQEAIGRLLRVHGADDAARRREVASRLVAVIHLRKGQVVTKGFVLPTAWYGSPLAVDGIVKDGLRSVVPERGVRGGRAPVALGRSYFAQVLGPSALEQALSWDLEES